MNSAVQVVVQEMVAVQYVLPSCQMAKSNRVKSECSMWYDCEPMEH